jgi:hypothetical protein
MQAATLGETPHEIVIVDYANPRDPKLVSTVHIKGQRIGEDYDPQDAIKNNDGTLQQIWCHEIFYDKDTLYVAWRDAGMVVIDVSDRANPVIISRLDYVPPFQGQGFGAAHTSMPVIVDPKKYPTLVINSDELFQCPGGFVRVMDISNLAYPQIVSSYRIPSVDDVYNFTTGQFVCPPGSHSSHPMWLAAASPTGLVPKVCAQSTLESVPAARVATISRLRMSAASSRPMRRWTSACLSAHARNLSG